MIYFMQITNEPNAIKIGCSADPVRRAQQIGWKIGGRLELLTTISGEIYQEADIHRKFAHLRLEKLPEPYRISGNEWYGRDAELTAFIHTVANARALPLALHERRHDYVLSLLASGMSKSNVARRIGVQRSSVDSILISINWHRRISNLSIPA